MNWAPTVPQLRTLAHLGERYGGIDNVEITASLGAVGVTIDGLRDRYVHPDGTVEVPSLDPNALMRDGLMAELESRPNISNVRLGAWRNDA